MDTPDRSADSMLTDLTRRDVMKLGAAATLAATLGVTDVAASQGATFSTFFTGPEFALVEELSEMIVPADEHSPGAKAAKVAAYIDGRLAEASEPADRTTWRDGLALVDQLSRATSGKPFLESSPAERLSLLARIAQNEQKPQKPEEHFFVELKGRVVHAYYTSEIGIKQELEYKGNTYLAEFVGVDLR
jgi:gluconate 2-dehydrogenase subunit 3-like protein